MDIAIFLIGMLIALVGVNQYSVEVYKNIQIAQRISKTLKMEEISKYKAANMYVVGVFLMILTISVDIALSV